MFWAIKANPIQIARWNASMRVESKMSDEVKFILRPGQRASIYIEKGFITQEELLSIIETCVFNVERLDDVMDIVKKVNAS